MELPKDLKNIIINYKNSLENYELIKNELIEIFKTKENILKLNIEYYKNNVNDNFKNFLIENTKKDIYIKKSNSFSIYGLIDKILYHKKKYYIYI